MSISAEEKVCYLREAAIVLAKEGFQLDEVHTDRLCILLDGSPLCEVTGSGGVAYRNEDIDEPERIAAKDKVYEIVRITAEYNVVFFHIFIIFIFPCFAPSAPSFPVETKPYHTESYAAYQWSQ